MKQTLPHRAPRPPGEVEELKRVWAIPKGWRIVSDVNNVTIGLAYFGAAFLFFLLAGVLALLMRTQLAMPESDFLGQDFYNQAFTVHGTTMMFLFAVPIVEALGVLLLPQMLAARDLPFPRLGAFAFWAYLIGGLFFFSSIFFDLAPKGGWFMYPPLTLTQYSPGDNADFWLLGIGFIEISAIAGAIEIIVGVLKTRTPGMTLMTMPIFAWAMLVFAVMIVFAFPAVILATMMLEIERAFGWPFFTAAAGGDPLLWQHLFWFFGHPEVYIIFLPAAGLVSMIVPTMARHPLVGYRLIVLALIGTGLVSFGLWVHHMFATGIPNLGLAVFSALSMVVAIPSGIQVFAWIATMAAGRRRFRITTPSLFVLGALFTFVLGGLTGVMVALVPIDFQVHDTYFIVAHLHYVLFGGMVFPLFAIIYYWTPMVSRQALSERVGRWVFALTFIGFNVAFLPMHVTGLRGMPRRVWTYPGEIGWDLLNLISTIGSYILAAGILLFLIDVFRRVRVNIAGDQNPWDAGTLEWLPTDVYSTRSVPAVSSREPLWDDPKLVENVEAGRYYLPNTPTHAREVIATTPIEGKPDYLIRTTGPGWRHVAAAVFMAGCFLLLTVKLVVPAAICAVLSLAAILAWAWQLDRGTEFGPIDIGGGIKVPVYVTGPRSHAWWAMVVLMLVGAALYLSYVFSYLYLWLMSPEVWSPVAETLPAIGWPVGCVVLLLAALAVLLVVRHLLPAPGKRGPVAALLLILAAALLLAAPLIDLNGLWRSGLRPERDAHGALAYLGTVINLQVIVAVAIMAGFGAARLLAGKLDRERRVTFEITSLLAWYGAGQQAFTLLLVHGFPRFVG